MAVARYYLIPSLLNRKRYHLNVQFPKSYAVGIAVALLLLTVALLTGVYFYMQASLRD